MTDQVGALLSEENFALRQQMSVHWQRPWSSKWMAVIPIQEKDKRSFEALSAVAYRPDSIQEIDKHHRQSE